MIDYPALHYPVAISEILSEIKFVDIPKEIQNGLKNEIKLVDFDGKLTNTASIDENGQVYFSVAYAQLIWFLCYISIYVYDYTAVGKELANYNKHQQTQFISSIEQFPEIKQYIIDLFKEEDCHELLDSITELCYKISSQLELNEENISLIESFDVQSPLCSKIGSAYCYAMAFILLHEFSHHSLHHDFTNDGDIYEEIDADDNAFLSMISDFTGTKDFTSKIGIISALGSFIFVNPTLKNYAHPDSDDRLFGYFDQIDGLKGKGERYLIIILTAWAICFSKKDFPKANINESDEVTLQRMRDYLSSNK